MSARAAVDGRSRRSSAHPPADRAAPTIVSSPLVSRCAVGSSRSRTAGSRSERTGDRETLPLATAEPGPAFADARVESVRQVGDDLGGPGQADRVEQLACRRCGAGEPQVVGNRAVEEARRLRHVPDDGPPGAQLDVGELDAADEDPAIIRFEEPKQEAGQRGLPGTARPDDRQPAPGGDGERHAIERGPIALGVLVAHAIECDGRRSRDLPGCRSRAMRPGMAPVRRGSRTIARRRPGLRIPRGNAGPGRAGAGRTRAR